MNTNNNPTAVAAWQARMSLTDRQAATALGLALKNYQRHKLGRLGSDPATANTKKHILLACAAIEAGLKPISEPNETSAKR